jgi:hypothetical protein
MISKAEKFMTIIHIPWNDPNKWGKWKSTEKEKKIILSFQYFIKGNYPYKSNGYASEPDANYDSDYVLKYHSVDRKRTTSIGNQYEDKWVDKWWWC